MAELTYQEDIDAPRLPQQLKCRRSAIWLMTHTVIMNPHYMSACRNIGLDLSFFDNYDLIKNSARSDECMLDCPMNDSDIPQFELSGSDPLLQLHSVIIINIKGQMSLQSHRNRPRPPSLMVSFG